MTGIATDDTSAHRIRSYVLRQGRITAAQRRALADLMPRFGLDPGEPFDQLRAFGRQAPLSLEVGFGNGDTLVRLAETRTDEDFLGIEVHPPGVGHLLLEMEKRGLSNIRVYWADAVEILEKTLPDRSLDGMLVFFPDPWHKKRHHKRRLVDPDFVQLAARKLKSGGLFHAATDWESYAAQMLAAAQSCSQLQNCSESGGFSPPQAYRPLTKFEERGRRLGHPVWDILFKRV